MARSLFIFFLVLFIQGLVQFEGWEGSGMFGMWCGGQVFFFLKIFRDFALVAFFFNENNYRIIMMSFMKMIMIRNIKK